ncbi:hypothetical protein M9H77_17675 [Catharanthus roseus]|uniref:Uncharacterized protein n=1 Tax=Catharanthus roseus TaxID=4058 RepID=A0ACC0B5H6_CATRO|nr:hypothetical protein M9H77_17675 [Catharanthus roseus]
MIPHFRKILLSAFECPHCGESSLLVTAASVTLIETLWLDKKYSIWKPKHKLNYSCSKTKKFPSRKRCPCKITVHGYCSWLLFIALEQPLPLPFRGTYSCYDLSTLFPSCFSHSLELNLKTLDRQVVKSETATIKVPELDLEIPPEAQRGSLSTGEDSMEHPRLVVSYLALLPWGRNCDYWMTHIDGI